MHRIATVLREIARGALAALIAGVVVGGLGGRLAMTIAAVLNPTATGLSTENGEVIGRFTVSGTLALLFFGGLGAGLLGAVIWVVISPWLPKGGVRRALTAAVAAVGLTSFLLISGTNPDFLLLRPRPVILAMLVILVALAGVATAWLDRRLEQRLRRSPDQPGQDVLLYGLLALPGVPVFLLTLNAFFGADFATSARPPFVGLALVVVGLATAFGWVLRIRREDAAVPAPVSWGARLALVVAVALGCIHLGAEAGRVLRLG